MKLHLPKLLCVALMSVLALPVMGASLTSDNIATPVEGGASYLNVGTDYATDTWSGDLVVGDTAEAQGDVDNVGAFTDSWGWVTPNGKTTITSTLKVNGALTVQGAGKVVLGGQSGSNYTGLEATGGITVTGGTLTSTKITTTDLNVSGGTVSTSTSNCTSGNSVGTSSFYLAKKSYIKNSLTLSGGSVSFGYTSNVQGVGGGGHCMTAFGSSSSFTMTQTGGTLRVYGDMDLKSGSTINQQEDAGIMVLRDTIYMGDSGTTTFNQSGDDAKLVLGRLESTGNKWFGGPECDFVFNQSGSGLIHLAYGSNLYEAGTITLNQTGAGTINIGGGHDTKITGSLPNRSDYSLTSFEAINTTYTINQTGTGTITLNSGAAITVNNIVANGTLNNNGTMNVTGEVNQTAGTINVAANASMTASSVSVGGVFEVAEGGSLVAGAIKVTEGGTLINNGVISGSAPAMADADELAALANDDMLIVIAGGSMENYGETDKNILVQDGGTLTLGEKASVGGVEITGGNINVNGDVTVSGALTLTGGTVTFMEDAVITLADGVEVVIEGASIVVNLSDASLDSLVNGGVYTLFNTTSDLESIDGSTMTFVGTSGDTITTTVNYAGEGAVEFAPVVPEPTTSTLSLLALAGLAARRRRK